jgi:hypothetical protein
MTDFVEALQANGRYTFTQAEAVTADKRSDSRSERQPGNLGFHQRVRFLKAGATVMMAGVKSASLSITLILPILKLPAYDKAY